MKSMFRFCFCRFLMSFEPALLSHFLIYSDLTLTLRCRGIGLRKRLGCNEVAFWGKISRKLREHLLIFFCHVQCKPPVSKNIRFWPERSQISSGRSPLGWRNLLNDVKESNNFIFEKFTIFHSGMSTGSPSSLSAKTMLTVWHQ